MLLWKKIQLLLFQVNLFTCLPNVSHDRFTYTSIILCLFLLPVLCNFTSSSFFVDCNLKPFTPKEFLFKCLEKEKKIKEGRVVHKVQMFVSMIDKTSSQSFQTCQQNYNSKIWNCKKLLNGRIACIKHALNQT